MAVNDEDIESIDFASFPSLKGLTILCASPPKNITDRTVLHVLKIDTQLEGLEIINAAITDDAVAKPLRKQQNLLSVDFSGTRIGDQSLRVLGKMPDLGILNLAGTKATDKGCAELGKLAGLISLTLSRTEISAGLAEIMKVSGLVGLDLNGTKVTDQGILQPGLSPNCNPLGYDRRA